jgi:hypothetical protein
LLLLAAGILIAVKLLLPLFSHRGRRLLLGGWRRLRHFEFWPLGVFYTPVVLYIAWLGLRHRSPLLFTAANPAIPASGVISEPKHEILRGLRGAGELVARTRLIPAGAPAGERIELAARLLAELGCGYPLVLKPDAGQRGSGVAVVRSDSELAAYLERVLCDTLIQEYVPGEEFGVFYYRYPDESRGRILSVTEKKMPEVVGDGCRTLEQLILDDPRAVCMARVYLHRHAARLQEIPAAGEAVRLVELGTHCRGAVFLDGSRVVGEALTTKLDEISKGYAGFYFGRYDLRVESEEALRNGRGFKIIELNGVTSEATHIYDPDVGLGQAWGVLFEQWRIAFEIGRQNRDRGHLPAKVRTLLGLLKDYRVSSRSHPA